MLPYNYIVIEGNIGTGKTSLALRLSQQFNLRFIPERFADNPFLPKFYEEPERFAFPLELMFLAERYQQLNDRLSSQELFQQHTISDYLLSKSLIFAGINLKEDEWKLYQRLFHIINTTLPKPDLLLYLHKDVPLLQKNIRKRGRSYEQNISASYLEKIQQGYFDFFKVQPNIRIIVADTNDIDFVNNGEDYLQIVELIHRNFEPGIHRIGLK